MLVVVAATMPVAACGSSAPGGNPNTMRVGGIVCLDLNGIRFVQSDMTEAQLDAIRCIRTPRELPFVVVDRSVNPPALRIAVSFTSGVREYWTRLQDTYLMS
jgi:hypothetical protein